MNGDGKFQRMHFMKTISVSFVGVFGFATLLASSVHSVSAQSRPPDVPLPGNTAASTISIPAAFTQAVVRPKATKVRSPGLSKGQPAPDFQLKDVDGHVVKLSDFKGKVVVLNFWAMWCGHCVLELPDFVELERKYKERGLEVIGVTADDYARLYQGALSPDPPLKAKLKAFAMAKHMAYPILMDTAEVSESYPHSGLPVTYVIDRGGVLRETALGEWHLAQAENAILPLLAK
jgi:peroxiredoxin